MVPPPKPPTSLPPPPANNGAKTTKANIPKLGRIKPVFRPPLILLNAVEGWGKTSMGAYAPNPAILMAKDETGYETLLGSNLVPSCDSARMDDWGGILGMLEEFDDQHTVVLDAIGGFERACHEYICDREFDGDWGERGFASYQKGYDISITEWLKLLGALERIRDKGSTVVILSHCRIKTFKNPLGADFDRYVSDVHDKTFAATARCADIVLFGNFFTAVETIKSSKPEALKKGKGIGGSTRVVYTERRDAFDAKNRYNMDEMITIPDDPSKIWETIWNNIKKG